MQMHLFYSYMCLKHMCWAEVSMPFQNCMHFKKGRIYLPHRVRSFSPYQEEGIVWQLTLGRPEKHENVRDQEIERKMDKGEGRDGEWRKRRG